MISKTSLVLIAVYFFGLIIFLDAHSLRNVKQSSFHRDDRHNFVPLAVINLGENITNFGLELGLMEPNLVKERADLGEWPYYVTAGLHAIELFKNTGAEAGRAFLFRSLELKTIDNPELYTEQVIRERFGRDPNNIIESINSVVEMFAREVESELAEKFDDYENYDDFYVV